MINLITISRERGSGGRSVGTRLAQELGMECFGKEIIYDIAQSAGVAKESVEKYDQENYNKWNLIVDSLRISSHFSPDYGFNFSLANIEPEIFFTEDKYLKTTQEILSLEEVTKLFDVANINRKAAVFDLAKCEWMNQQYILRMTPEDLTEAVVADSAPTTGRRA